MPIKEQIDMNTYHDIPEMDAIRAEKLLERRNKGMLYGITLIAIGIAWIIIELSGSSLTPVMKSIADWIIQFSILIRELIGQIVFPIILLLVGIAILAGAGVRKLRKRTILFTFLSAFLLPFAVAVLVMTAIGWFIDSMQLFMEPYVSLSFLLPFMLVGFVNYLAKKFIPLFINSHSSSHE